MPPFVPRPSGVTNTAAYTREMVRATATESDVFTEIARFTLENNCAYHLVLSIVGKDRLTGDDSVFYLAVTGRCFGGTSVDAIDEIQMKNGIGGGDYRVKPSGYEIVVSVKSQNESSWTCAISEVKGIVP